MESLCAGQYLLFKSNLQQIDTFIVSEVRKISTSTEGYSECMEVSREKLSVSIRHISNGFQENSLDVFATFDGSPAIAKIFWVSFTPSKNYSNSLRPLYIYLPSESPATSMVINGSTYNNVYEIDMQNETMVDSISVVKYYFNKEYGVLKYVYKSGKYYELIK